MKIALHCIVLYCIVLYCIVYCVLCIVYCVLCMVYCVIDQNQKPHPRYVAPKIRPNVEARKKDIT